MFAYDNYNRLISYESGDVHVAYTYNTEDYRTGKLLWEDGFFTETHYIYEGSHVIIRAKGKYFNMG
ncbi:MAG: hypothetical protein J6J42_13435 [Lachnospiraceae bacterium]|nr:hypothetical protein [Lachnospiraceae bacterium]